MVRQLVSLLVAMIAIGVASMPTARRMTAAQASSLRIVVIAGEDAVNIIQQKTAVAPIVEVRDRNDQPVAGAVVNFAIRGGRATFGGARTLAVTTDVAGRAMAAGFTPTASGAVQISASAAFQGQTAAAVTIAQTNVMTAAQAAAVSGAGGAGGGSTGATTGAAGGAGGGGGISATTIGIVGGAVAGGAVVAKQVLGNGRTAFVGSFSGQMAEVFTGCTRNHAANGQMTIELDDPAATTPTGSGTIKGTFVGNGTTCVNDPFATRTQNFDDTVDTISGQASALTFRIDHSNAVSNPPGATYRNSFTFNGALAGGEIVGTVTFDATTTSANGGIIGVSREVYPVALRMQ